MNTMSLKELEEAFGVFSNASSELEDAYASLERRVAILTEALKRERADRQRHEQERNRLSHKLDCLIDALPGAVVVIDDESRVRQFNCAAQDIFGERLLGADWSTISGQTLTAVGPGAEFALTDGRRLSLAKRSLAPNPGEVLLFTDVTENRAVENLSQQHQRLAAMGEMAAALAHQIRTPLAAALLYASSAASSLASAEQRSVMMDKTVGRLHDLEHLVDDMLLFARGAGPLDSDVAVAEILRVAVTTIRSRLLATQRVSISPVQAGLTVTGSEQALSGALINLINNALEAAGRAAEVEVSAETKADGSVEFAVLDNGPGIAAGNEESIFEPFFSGRSDGTGLGLAVVRSIARQHGGESWAEKGRETGARILIRLPANAGKRSDHEEAAA